jgi:hypothetical protein
MAATAAAVNPHTPDAVGIQAVSGGKHVAPEIDGPISEDAPYPHYEPGVYEAFCIKSRIYLNPLFRAWKCDLQFVFGEDNRNTVFGFFHLGNGDQPRVGRQSQYRRAWIIANDGEQPKKRQTLSKRVFVGKFYRVRIADTVKRSNGSQMGPGEIYSTVKEIIEKIGP